VGADGEGDGINGGEGDGGGVDGGGGDGGGVDGGGGDGGGGDGEGGDGGGGDGGGGDGGGGNGGGDNGGGGGAITDSIVTCGILTYANLRCGECNKDGGSVTLRSIRKSILVWVTRVRFCSKHIENVPFGKRTGILFVASKVPLSVKSDPYRSTEKFAHVSNDSSIHVTLSYSNIGCNPTN